MYITSHELAQFAEDFYKKLQEVRNKINFYSQEELKKRDGSNFSLELSENLDKRLLQVKNELFNREDMRISLDIVNDLKKEFDIFDKQFNDFNTLCDSIYNSEDGSFEKVCFDYQFSTWAKTTIQLILEIYEEFIDKFQIKDLVAKNQMYQQILENAKDKENEMQNALDSIKTKTDKLVVNLEQKVAEHKIQDIKTYYSQTIDSIKDEKNLYGWGFLSASIILLVFLILLFFKMNDFFPKEEPHLIIPRSILSCSFIGLFSFLINDFRKRFNICKNILDELNQKVIVVDTYTSLLSRIQDFDEETKKKYHDKIIQNIIDTLLLIRNHGYLSKLLNQSDPNLASKIVEQLGSLVSQKN